MTSNRPSNTKRPIAPAPAPTVADPARLPHHFNHMSPRTDNRAIQAAPALRARAASHCCNGFSAARSRLTPSPAAGKRPGQHGNAHIAGFSCQQLRAATAPPHNHQRHDMPRHPGLRKRVSVRAPAACAASAIGVQAIPHRLLPALGARARVQNLTFSLLGSSSQVCPADANSRATPHAACAAMAAAA